jgi:hypothetical protein
VQDRYDSNQREKKEEHGCRRRQQHECAELDRNRSGFPIGGKQQQEFAIKRSGNIAVWEGRCWYVSWELTS